MSVPPTLSLILPHQEETKAITSLPLTAELSLPSLGTLSLVSPAEAVGLTSKVSLPHPYMVDPIPESRPTTYSLLLILDLSPCDFFFFKYQQPKHDQQKSPGLWFFLHLPNELPSTSQNFLKEESTLLISTSSSPIYSFIHNEPPPPRPSALRSPGAHNYQIKCLASVPASW